MLSKLPRWIEYGSFALAFIAGSVNAVGVLGFAHQSVTHLTGTSTLLGIQLVSGDLEMAAHLVLIIASFVAGATLAGFIVRDASLELGRRYGVCLSLESALLLLALLVLTRGSNAGHLLASAACGLQNAMVTSYSGAIIRTTHVTGLFTDLGLMLGRRLRGLAIDRRRARLYLLIVLGFVLGGSIGALLWARIGYNALALPAAFAFALAVTYWWGYWFVRQRIDAQTGH